MLSQQTLGGDTAYQEKPLKKSFLLGLTGKGRFYPLKPYFFPPLALISRYFKNGSYQSFRGLIPRNN